MAARSSPCAAAGDQRTDRSVERFRLALVVAEHELRLGNEEEAIARFEEAYAQIPALGESVSADDKLAAVFRLGVAHLRSGETRNCAINHSAESCIMPIRGRGVHVDPEGSRTAIRYFAQVLERTPRNVPLHLKAVWLTNLAYMTLGAYPDGVPTDYRIPPTVFGADESFPRFENVAPRKGLASFNLSGGVVLDDLDGDGLLDLFTSTFDTGGEPHFFHGTGDGGFVDHTGEAGLTGLYGGLNVVDADYDNDGDLDLFILRGAWLESAGRYPNSLLRNNSDPTKPGSSAGTTFTDVTFEAGLGQVHYPTQTAAWADYDNDGDVDLFIGNEHGVDPTGERNLDTSFDAPSQLFRNNGDGTFTDVARQAGVDVSRFRQGSRLG